MAAMGRPRRFMEITLTLSPDLNVPAGLCCLLWCHPGGDLYVLSAIAPLLSNTIPVVPVFRAAVFQIDDLCGDITFKGLLH